jgi:uncharacterized protein YecE (DUF72 family)
MSERLHPSGPPFRVGCAGWALASKYAEDFPGEGTNLERYANVFSCVEINSSFYRSHQAKTYRRWAASVPDTFRFSVKTPRTITHDLRLKQCDAPLQAFLTEVTALGDKLGCVLIQLPPSLEFDVRSAGAFFSLVRKHTQVAVACERRHLSWFTPKAASFLRDVNVSFVWAHPSPVAGVEPPNDPTLLYMRLHGAPQVYYSAYDDAFIDGVAARMRLADEEGKVAWCIFDNTARGEAIPNALGVLQQLKC